MFLPQICDPGLLEFSKLKIYIRYLAKRRVSFQATLEVLQILSKSGVSLAGMFVAEGHVPVPVPAI